MLVEPPEDAERLALDRALIAAARARIAAGARGSADADAIALREILAEIPATERPALRAVLGRIEAATGPALAVCGTLSQALAADRWGYMRQQQLNNAPDVEPGLDEMLREYMRTQPPAAPGVTAPVGEVVISPLPPAEPAPGG